MTVNRGIDKRELLVVT